MIFLLLSMQSGWTQNWTVSKANNDTVLIYKFSKEQISNLHKYVVSLEDYKKINDLNEKIIINKDSIIAIDDKQIKLRDDVITKNNKKYKLVKRNLTIGCCLSFILGILL